MAKRKRSANQQNPGCFSYLALVVVIVVIYSLVRFLFSALVAIADFRNSIGSVAFTVICVIASGLVAFLCLFILFRHGRKKEAVKYVNKHKLDVPMLNDEMNHSYDLATYFKKRDALLPILQILARDERLVKNYPISPLPSKILELLKENENLQVHTAIQRMAENYRHCVKSGSNFLSNDFWEMINRYKDRISVDNMNYAHECWQSICDREAEVREEERIKRTVAGTLRETDGMDGRKFEYWCADLVRRSGFCEVAVTPGSGDQGVDITAEKDGVRYAIQCKCYSADVGNTPIQEVYAGKEMYGCQVGVVMTNQHFTAGAKQLAAKTKVLLWDRDKLCDMLKKST